MPVMYFVPKPGDVKDAIESNCPLATPRDSRDCEGSRCISWNTRENKPCDGFKIKPVTPLGRDRRTA